MSLTGQSVRIAGNTYDLTVEKIGQHFTVRVKQYPGIMASFDDEGRAVDSVIKAIIDKISEKT